MYLKQRRDRQTVCLDLPRLRRFRRAIEDATLTSRVTAVDGDVVSVRLEGRPKAGQNGDWPIRGFDDMNRPSRQERGLEMKLLGSARAPVG
jgi:hypothetical protein